MRWLTDLVAAVRTAHGVLIVVVAILGAVIEHVAAPVDLVLQASESSFRLLAAEPQSPPHLFPLE